MVKVAIVQNKLGMDGRSRVVAEIIELLNRRGICPAVFVLAGKNLPDTLEYAFGKRNLQFQLRTLLPINTLKTGTILQETLLNLLLRRRIASYDLVINSNDSLAWWPEGPQYIHYIHIPPKATMVASKAVHRRAVWSLYSLPLWLLEEKAPLQLQNAILIANSHYTAGLIEQFYGIPQEKVSVIYPPAGRGKVIESTKSRIGVVSCGAFSPRKRQIDQLRIAKALPDVEFMLLGTVTSPSYLKSCQAFVQENQLHNVKLIPDASAQMVKDTLASSRFFLHTRHNEEFGIAIVEAIECGCIPIVHDSGGPREIVSLAELRYQTLDEATEKIRDFQNTASDILPTLKAFVTPFSSQVFTEKMEAVFAQTQLASQKRA